MTATVRYLDGPAELESLWPRIWPLLDASHQFHADLIGKELRPRREERAREGILGGLQRGGYWFQIAEQDGEIVGTGSANIRPRGRTFPGPVGEADNLYLKESVRGQGLRPLMYETRLDTLRQGGVMLVESATSTANSHAHDLWGDRSWGYTLRRPLQATDAEPPASLRRVRDLDDDWPGIWRLLQDLAGESEAEARSRLQADLARRGAAFVAGQEPEAVIIGRVSINPWLFLERVGVVTALAAGGPAQDELAAALLSRMERWMAGKQATDIETLPLPHGSYGAWSERGFQPHLFWLQDRL